ncbi:MAG: NAD-dependent epimerase/dehydratase family protein [Candidatus Helarchaeota archaeon]
MNFLVTGANGFIGSNLIEKLIERGHQVRAMVLEGTDESNIENIKDKIEKVYGDITRPESLNFFNGIDVVIHLAALLSDWGPDEIFMRINFEGTRNVLNAAIKAGVKRFVFMSSLTVHGFKNFNNANEETTYNPYNGYARSKKAVEDLLNGCKWIETVIVRPGFVIFGPRDRLFSYEAYSRVENGKLYGTINKGKALTCYSYVENLVDGLILVSIHEKAANSTFIITDGPIITWKEFNEKMFAPLEVDLRKKAKFSSIPYGLAYFFVGLLEGVYKLFRRKQGPILTLYRIKVQSKNLAFINSKIVNELDYNPKITLDEAFKRTYEWYKTEKNT